MSKIELPSIANPSNVSLMNSNFKKIEDTLNEEVLYRKGYTGEPNEMNTNLDMNGNKILNVSTGSGPSDLATRGYVDAQIAEERGYVDQQLDLVDSELDTKYDKAGGPVFGDIQMQGHRIVGLPNATQPSEPATYDQLLQVESAEDSLLRNDLAASSGSSIVGYTQGIPGTVSRTAQSKSRDLVSIKDFGAVGDGVANDTDAFNASNGTPIQIPDGEYLGDPTPFTVMGLLGRVKSTLKQIATTGNFLSFFNCGGGILSNLSIKSNKQGVSSAAGHQIAIKDGNDFTLENINFGDAEGQGFSILSYPEAQANQSGLIIRSIRGRYNASALHPTSGCVLLALGKTSLIDGVLASQYGQFGAVELKDAATNNIISNIVTDGCESAVYLGTETSLSPNRNIITSVMAKDSRRSGIDVQLGGNNLIQGVLADYTNSEATQPHGVSISGNANAADNVYYMGVDGTTPIGGLNQAAYAARFRDTARNNYVSAFTHHTATGGITFEVGTQRNFVDIKHPGNRTDLWVTASFIGDKATIDGTTNSNVVHCAPLGQYFGSMSGRFEWRMRDVVIPGSTLFSGDKWRFIDSGAPSLVIGGGTSAQCKLFNSDGAFKTLNLASNGNLRLDAGSSQFLQIEAAALTPSTTGTYALGSASRAWSGGFTQTAFTITSDERSKTLPIEITEAMLDAAAEVDWVQYQYLDRVEAKGPDGARWHFGAVAQRYVEAFARHGLDAHDYGFICYDEWDDVYEPVVATRENPETSEQEEYDTGEVKLVQSAGNRYGIRYEEALALEAALQRRNYQRLLARVEALEATNG